MLLLPLYTFLDEIGCPRLKNFLKIDGTYILQEEGLEPILSEKEVDVYDIILNTQAYIKAYLSYSDYTMAELAGDVER